MNEDPHKIKGTVEVCPDMLIRDINSGMTKCGAFVVTKRGCDNWGCPIRAANQEKKHD